MSRRKTTDWGSGSTPVYGPSGYCSPSSLEPSATLKIGSPIGDTALVSTSQPLAEETKARMEMVCLSLREGLPPKHACAVAGITYKDFEGMMRGSEQMQLAVSQARAEFTAARVRNIALAGMPRTRKTVTPDGEVTYTEVVGDWKADAWLLERVERDTFGKSEAETKVHMHLDLGELVRATAQDLAAKGAIMTMVPGGALDAEFEDFSESD